MIASKGSSRTETTPGFRFSLRVLAERLSFVGRTRAGRVSLLLVIMTLGALVRLEVLYEWLAEPDKFFYLGEPLERSVDGYRILTHARDLLDGSYQGFDQRRQVPDYVERPWPPMLFAVIAAGLHHITGVSLNWIAGWIPVLLGTLIALPLYALGRFYGGTVMGLSSALLGTLAMTIVTRSSFAWFDTDCLNVTLLLGTAYYALRFGVSEGKQRYLFLGFYVLLTLVFAWWWWPIREIAFGMSLVPLAVALLFHYRPPPTEAFVFSVILVGFLVVLLLALEVYPEQILTRLRGLYDYIAQKPVEGLPVVGEFNSEQKRVSMRLKADWSAGGFLGFGLGWAGIAWLFWRRFRTALYLLALAAVSFLAAFYAVRFLIFLSAFLSLGTGFVLGELWRLRHRYAWVAVLPLIILPSILWPQVKTVFAERPVVHQSPRLVGALATTGRNLPEDAVVWSNWSNGNAIFYWSDRGTIADGDHHGPRLMIYNFFPFAVDNDRLAANFMRWYVARGRKGIAFWNRALGNDQTRSFARLRELLSLGPRLARDQLARTPLPAYKDRRTTEDWVEFLFPSEARPLYLLLDLATANALVRWWPLATWEYAVGKGRQAFYQTVLGIELDSVSADNWKDAMIAFSRKHGNFGIDPYTGVLYIGNRKFELAQLAFTYEGRTRIERFRRSSEYSFDVNADTGLGALTNSVGAKSLFNRLFLRQSPSSNFLPMDLGAPDYQLWEVRADQP